MAKVIFESKKDFPIGRICVSIGQHSFNLKRGESKIIELPQNEHEIIVKKAWGYYSSLFKLDLKENDNKRIVISQYLPKLYYVISAGIVLIISILCVCNKIPTIVLSSYVFIFCILLFYVDITKRKNFLDSNAKMKEFKKGHSVKDASLIAYVLLIYFLWRINKLLNGGQLPNCNIFINSKKIVILKVLIMKKSLIVCLLLFVTISLSAQDAKYEIKSAIIKKEMTMMGQKIETINYIDDFGKKESGDMNFPGVGNLRIIQEGQSVITVNLDSKQAMRANLPEKPINYLQLTPEVREKYNIKETGEEEIAGKVCKKYSLDVVQMGQSVEIKAWVWKGIVLKSETAGNGMIIVDKAIEIQENAEVPADKFVVPDGISVAG